MTKRRFTRRQLLHGTATAIGVAAVSRALPGRPVRSPSVPMRSVGSAAGTGLEPSIAPFVGLSGFEDRLLAAGASGPFRWNDLPPAPGEAAVLLSGFVAEGVSLRRAGLVFEGHADPTAVRMLALDPGPSFRAPAVPATFVETRRTPAGVPFTEAFLPADAPETQIPASFADASGGLFGTVMVPVRPLG